jgi:hypothetical protein
MQMMKAVSLYPPHDCPAPQPVASIDHTPVLGPAICSASFWMHDGQHV